MATFQARVQGITGLTISSSGTNPTEAELTEYLKDGILDVTNKLVAIDPNGQQFFTTVTSKQTSNGANLNSARIVSVVREAGVEDDWRECRFVPPEHQGRLVDTSSLSYASKYNPAYTVLDDSKISVFPVADASPNAFKIYYVNNDPLRGDGGAEVSYSESDIANFPLDRVYLVVIYASIRALDNALSAKTGPVIAGDATELTNVSSLTDNDTIDSHTDQIEIDQWWSTIGHLIEGEEDNELATVQIQKMRAYVEAHQSQLQSNSAEYGWMDARKQVLQLQYNQAFGILAQKKQEGR